MIITQNNFQAKTYVLFGLFMIFCHVGFSQDLDNHDKIPRSRFSIDLPEDYYVHPINTAILKDEMNYFVFSTFHHIDYFDYVDSLKKNDINLVPTLNRLVLDTVVSGMSAVLVREFDPDFQLAYVYLSFGKASTGIIITGQYQCDFNWKDDDVIVSLLGVKYDDEKVIDPYDQCIFDFDTTSTNFRFTDFNAMGQYTFTQNRTDFKLYKTHILIGVDEYTPGAPLSQLVALRIVNAGDDGFTNFSIASDKEWEKKKLTFYDVLGSFYQNNKKWFFNIRVITDKKATILCFGIAPSDNPELQEQVKTFNSKISFSSYWIALNTFKN